MMDLEPKLQKLIEICQANDVAMLGVFGSVARGDDNPESDIDLLVKLRKPTGLIGFIALEEKLKKVLGRKVDLTTEGSLHPRIRSNVMKDLKIICER